jgi:hypothetical protein
MIEGSSTRPPSNELRSDKISMTTLIVMHHLMFIAIVSMKRDSIQQVQSWEPCVLNGFSTEHYFLARRQALVYMLLYGCAEIEAICPIRPSSAPPPHHSWRPLQ